MRLSIFILLLLAGLADVFVSASPIIVLPPFLKIRENNVITIVNDSPKKSIVQVDHGGEITKKVMEKGLVQTISFQTSSAQRTAHVLITVDGKKELDQVVPVRPDVFNVHIHIDKTVYRKSETVNVRVLPLTHDGNVYRGDLKICLINGKGFVESATMKTIRVDEINSIISEKLEIPSHTFFGDWSVKVQPVELGDKLIDNRLVFEKAFQVQDYDLPNYKLYGFIEDNNDLENTKVTVEAKYFHGRPVNGSVHVYCREIGSTSQDRSHLIHVKSGEFDNGIWSANADLGKCDPFNSPPKEIFIEARENGTGYRQDLVLSWDVTAPKFTVTAVRPYFTKDTEDVILLIDGDGISRGNVSILLRCFSEKTPTMRTKEVKVGSKIGEALKIRIPEEWRSGVSVIRVIAHRTIKNGQSNSTMLYIPNLSGTSLNSALISPEVVKPYYEDGEIMEVNVKETGKELNFVIVCNAHTIHRVPNDVKNNVLRVKITDKMEGTCLLSAFSAEPMSDVMLFRVQNQCEDCKLKVSKLSDGLSKELGARDVIEPGDEVELEFFGHSDAVVFYRAMDERLNYITLKNDYMAREYQDYLIFGKQGPGAKVLNLVNEEAVEKAMESVCTSAGFLLRFNCEQGKRSTSLVSEKCLKHVLNRCFKNSSATVLPILTPYIDRKTQLKTASATNWLDNMSLFRARPPKPPLALFVKPELHDPGIERQKPKLRQHFPETWLFDAIVLERNGTKKITAKSPDNVGQWALSSAYWWHGRVALFPGQTKYIQTSKPIFLDVDMPRNVYVNETISPLLTVTGIDLKKSRETFVICMSELPRKVCADQGANGNKGDTYYMKVELTRSSPIQSKYLMMKFLSPGLVNMTVTLRSENCETGRILDAVRKQIEIQKRADTEEYYERHILNPSKPLVTAMNDDPGSPSHKDMEMITFSDQHASTDDADTINTLITSNVPDTETVFSFSITLSKFLPLTDRIVTMSMGTRYKRNGQRLLTSVIKELAVVLYNFKKRKLSGYTSYQMEAEINDLINELMQFSNCSSKKEPCGYYEFGRPQSSEEISILLTSIATSLLCEADVEEGRVLGSLKTITAYIPKLGDKDFDADLSDIIDVENIEDKKYLLVSFMYQVSRDCASYRGALKNMSKSFSKLHKFFYELDESNVRDGRTVGAIAFMATNATAELMRSDLLSKINKEHPPYWKCNGIGMNRVDKSIKTAESFRRRRESCQVMVNSFALSAIVTAYAEGTEIDWDRLADWISEQQSSDGSYGSPLTTLIATRSLYEKRRRTVEIEYNDHLEVTVKCKGCTEKRVNVTEHPIEIHIPNNIHYVTLITKGRGKAVVAARIVATKRPRPKRGLTQDDYYPVHLSIDQKVQDNFVHQTVCFNVTNPTIKTLDIFHGTYTLFSATPDQLYFMNDSYTPINPTTSALGLHFIITNIATNQTICYKVALSESRGGKNIPYKSAPVPIRATHPVQGLVGMLLIAHPDVPKNDAVVRRRRHHHHTRTRFVRRIIDESAVDTVCYDGGECSCAETTCSVKCKKCQLDTPEKLKELLSTDGFFGIRFELNAINSANMNGANYTIYDGTVKDSNGLGSSTFELSKKIRVWLRSCNVGCTPEEKILKRDYYVLGHEDGLNSDSYGRQNYILNHMDRFEESSFDCQSLNSAITIRY